MLAEEGEEKGVAVGWRKRGLVLLCYAFPLLLLGGVCLRTDPGGYVFWRNWLRAGCGPALRVMWRARLDPNDLVTYAAAFATIWPLWLLVAGLSPLHRLPLAVHASLGFLWCFGGCCLTAAI